MMKEPRDTKTRTQDTLTRLINDTDAMVATSDAYGNVHMVPLCFYYEQSGSLLMATPATNQTARNWIMTKKARVSLGHTRDMVMMIGHFEIVGPSELTSDLMDHYAIKTGWDPREFPEPHVYARFVPQRVQAWRELNEMAGREIMRHGRWIYTGSS
jgi:hypothetical protein